MFCCKEEQRKSNNQQGKLGQKRGILFLLYVLQWNKSSIPVYCWEWSSKSEMLMTRKRKLLPEVSLGWAGLGWPWRAWEQDSIYTRGGKLIFTRGHNSLAVAFKRPNVMLGMHKCNYSLTVQRELIAATGLKQGAGRDIRWRVKFGLWALHLPPVIYMKANPVLQGKARW